MWIDVGVATELERSSLWLDDLATIITTVPIEQHVVLRFEARFQA